MEQVQKLIINFKILLASGALHQKTPLSPWKLWTQNIENYNSFFKSDTAVIGTETPNHLATNKIATKKSTHHQRITVK